MPKLKTLPDTSVLEKLIKSQGIKEEVKIEILLECAGMSRGTYYRKVGKQYEKGQIEKLNLDELRRLSKALHIPKEELLDAIWAAIRY
jgi:hypothetical protein